MVYFFPCDKGSLAAAFPHPSFSPTHCKSCAVGCLTLERVKKPPSFVFFVKFVVLISGYFSPLRAACCSVPDPPCPVCVWRCQSPQTLLPSLPAALGRSPGLRWGNDSLWKRALRGTKEISPEAKLKGNHAKLQGPSECVLKGIASGKPWKRESGNSRTNTQLSKQEGGILSDASHKPTTFCQTFHHVSEKNHSLIRLTNMRCSMLLLSKYLSSCGENHYL